VERLCWIGDPYRNDAELDALFLGALNEVTAWHVERLDLYSRLWRAAGAPVVTRMADLAQQPFIHANLFKRHVIRSVPAEAIAVELSSSGTSGVPSRMCFDEWTMRTVQRMDARTFEFFGWTSADVATNYLIFGREPHPLAQGEVRSGVGFSVEYVCDFAPAKAVTYALRHTGAGHEFDVFGCVDALLRYSEDDAPTRLFGFPAFLAFTLDRLRALGAPPLRLPPGSLVLTGGGWKGYQDRHIPRAELTQRIEEQLGVPPERVRDIWGSVEHPLPYYECSRHHCHVPTWARALVRSVRTLEPVADGEPGYLQLISPYITSSPAHSVLMADLASRHPAAACGCGIPTPWLVFHGRAGVSRNRGCAVAAAELLRGRA
jgi:phenylacetate-coenzyme A ligase PaaK-like adenylate-forming protein